jgi:tungstate transport system ATP-binding protein
MINRNDRPISAQALSAQTLLEARDLRLVLGKREVFNVPQFTLSTGQVVALVGPNGAGKTSLLLTLALLQHPSEGSIHFNGILSRRENTLQLRRQMAVVFQEPLLMEDTVLGNVLIGLRIRGVPAPVARERAQVWLERLGIAHLKNRSAIKLSGGEAQRVNLARAFALKPHVLFLDEPFSALDYPTRQALLEEIGEILSETKIATLFVTHDYTEVPYFSHSVLVMVGGRIIKNGSVTEIFGDVTVPRRIPAPWKVV